MTDQWGGAPGGWYADFEWSGSQDVLSGVTQDFRTLPGWFTNQNLSAPVAAQNNQIACPVGLYLCEVFAGYDAAVTSAFRVQVLGDGGSFSKTVITSSGASSGDFEQSGLLTVFLSSSALLSLSVTVNGAGTVNINDLEFRISKLA